MMLAAQRNLFTGSFNPLSLSPALWLSDTGSNPAQWDDLSGNGRHATQATSGSRPTIVTNALNGRQVRRFDGINDFLQCAMSLSQPYSFFGVFKLNSSLQNKLRLIDATPNRYSVNNNNPSLFVNSFAGANVSVSPAGTNARIFSSVINGLSSLAALDGVATIGNSGTNSLGSTLYFGTNFDSTQWHDGDIAEILVFPTALSTENRRRIEGYLSSKYNIAIS